MSTNQRKVWKPKSRCHEQARIMENQVGHNVEEGLKQGEDYAHGE